jgi:hypothetical protein
MTDSSSNSMVSSVTYGASSELLGMTYRPNVSTPSITEARTYNSLGQLTNLTNTNYSGTFMSLQYAYPAGANNGKISSQKDWISGEEVVYAYDSLNRLISAVTTAASDQVATPWGQGFSYDGFGNLTAKTVLKGSAPTYSAYVDPGTNRAYRKRTGYGELPAEQRHLFRLAADQHDGSSGFGGEILPIRRSQGRYESGGHLEFRDLLAHTNFQRLGVCRGGLTRC